MFARFSPTCLDSQIQGFPLGFAVPGLHARSIVEQTVEQIYVTIAGSIGVFSEVGGSCSAPLFARRKKRDALRLHPAPGFSSS